MKSEKGTLLKITPYYVMTVALKSISQVILLENSITGLIILIAITIANYKLGIITLLSAIIGVLVAHATGGDKNIIAQGLFGYNSVLTGLALFLYLTGNMRWIVALVGAAFATIFTAAMMNFFKNQDIPVLTFPYIVLTWFVILASYHLEVFTITSSLVPQDLSHWQLEIKGPVYVTGGLIAGIGEIYFQDKLLPSILITLAIFWANKKIGIYAVIGATVSWITAYALGGAHNVINLGLYGYNGVLTIIAVSSVFDADRPFALIWGIASAIITVPITAAVSTWLLPYGLPALTMPFVLVTWIFVGARRILTKL